MKKVVPIVILIFALTSCAEDAYVDLGLPSGTLWKNQNESGDYYTYDQAVSQFGSSLPNKEQMEELIHSCTWTWTGSGYEVKGPNGKTITMPAAGYRYCDGDVYGIDTLGYYWTSTLYGSDYAWGLYFGSGDNIDIDYSTRCDGQSVRLVR